MDEEALLTHIDEDSQEAIVSNLGLHWVNDIPGQSHSPVFSLMPAEADVGDGTAICVCGSHPRRTEADPTRVETGRVLFGEHVGRG